MTETITLQGSPVTNWLHYEIVDSLTKTAGIAIIHLDNSDKAVTDTYEQYDDILINIDGTDVFTGKMEKITPRDDGVLVIEGRTLINQLQGEYIIESYGIGQVASNTPTLCGSGVAVTFNVSDTTGFEVGDEVTIADNQHFAISRVATVLGGTIEAGNVFSTNTDDGDYFQVGERAATGLEVTFAISLGAETNGDFLLLNGYYAGSATHHLDAYMWNYNDGAWEEVSDANNDMENESADKLYRWTLEENNHFNSAGQAQVRILHVGTPNNSHDLFVDYLAIERAGSKETATITAVVPNTSITVNELIRCYTTPTITVGEFGRDIIDDLVTKYGDTMSRGGIPATSPEKFIKSFKGITAYDAINEIGLGEEHEYGVNGSGDFFYQPANFEDSGVTITYGVSDVLDFDADRSGFDITNRVDLYGEVQGGNQIAVRVEDPASQQFYGQVKGTTIVDEKLTTVGEAEARGNSILAQKSFALKNHQVKLFGNEVSPLAGQLITLASFDGISDGLYLVTDRKVNGFEGTVNLTVANFKTEFEDKIADLLLRVKEREKEKLDEAATITKLLNFYEDVSFDDNIGFTLTKIHLNNTFILGRNANTNQSNLGRGQLTAAGAQLVLGRQFTEEDVTP